MFKADPIVRLLINQGTDINIRDNKNCTALRTAMYNGHSKIVQLLMKFGAEVNVEGALQQAAFRDDEEVVKLLCSGCEP